MEKELNEIVAEEEIELIQKQLFELKSKSGDNKGISTRLERAIEALGKSAPAEAFKSL